MAGDEFYMTAVTIHGVDLDHGYLCGTITTNMGYSDVSLICLTTNIKTKSFFR